RAEVRAESGALHLAVGAGDGVANLLWETGPDGSLPADWSGSAGFRFKVHNPMERTIYLIWRFYDRPDYTRGGEAGRETCFRMLTGLLPGMTAEVVLPREVLDSQTRYRLRPPGTGVIYTWGNAVDPRRIAAVRLMVQELEEPLSLLLEDVGLVRGEIAPAAPAGGPAVDRYGQWRAKEWPGKIRTDEGLRRQMQDEDRALAGAAMPASRGAYGGFRAKRFEPGGYFRVEREPDGRWWLVDPAGCAFYSTGIDCVRPWSEGPAGDAHLPLFETEPERYRPPRAENGETLWASPYTENLKRVYGSSWHEAWAEQAVRRHLAWGFNTIGNWSDPFLTGLGRLPYVAPLEAPRSAMAWRDFPDVCAPDFPEACAAFAGQTAARREDPMLIGHFLGNEPAWSRGTILAEGILAGAGSHTRAELLRRLAAAYGEDRAALNADWGTAYANWEEIGHAPWPKGSAPPAAQKVLRRLSGELVHRYYDGLIGALRRADPNHLILGIRFAGLPEEDYCLRGMDLADAVSLNFYAHEPPDLARLHAAVGRPLLIGEFHFGSLDRGAIAQGLCGVATDRDKGIAYRYIMEKLAAMPFTVGAHWFQFVDEPCFGRSDGENYACGFVDVANRPCPELVSAAQATNDVLYEVLTGARPPFAERPKPAKTGILWD
ncbi:MAG: hypothetical protein ACM3XS_10060, partial [Bacteroidota bacterium]